MKTFRILTQSIAALLLTPAAFAVTDTWDGGGADNNLSTALNWLDNTAPASDLVNTDLIFAGAVRLTPNLSASFSTNSVTFNNTAGAFTIGGQALTIGAGGIVNGDTQTQSFSNIVVLGAASTSFNAASGGLAFSNSVSIGSNALSLDGGGTFSFGNFGGLGTVTKTGAGTMTWSPGGTQSLNLVINAGTVNTGVDAPIDGFDASASIAINGTGTLNFNETATLTGTSLTKAVFATVSIAAGKTLTALGGASLVFNNGFINSGGGNLTMTGAGTTMDSTVSINFTAGGTFTANSGAAVTLTGNFDFTGSNAVVDGAGTSVTGGGGNNWGNNGSTANLTFSNNATASFTDVLLAATNTTNGTVGNVFVQSGADLTLGMLQVAVFNAGLTGAITVDGTGSTVTHTGASSITLGSSATSSATINVNNSGIYNTGTGTTQINKTGAININDGTFNSNGSIIINGVLNRSGTGSFILAPGKNLNAQNGALLNFGTGDLVAQGTSILSFVGAGTTYDGSFLTTLGVGSSISIAAGAVANINGNGTLQANAGNVTVDGAGSQLNVLGNAASTIGASERL